MIKSFIIGASTAAILTSSALAADMGPARAPLAPVFTWTGLYLGATAGWMGQDGGSTVGTNGFVNGGLAGGPATVAALSTATTGKTKDLSAFAGGGTLGYNYQIGAFVAGVEADIVTTSRSTDSRNFSVPVVGFAGSSVTGTAATSQRYNYFGTVRARLGYLLAPNLLVFATGGFAYGDLKDSTVFSFTPTSAAIPAATGAVSRSGTNTGYVVGGGIEYALDASWSVKAEGLYYDLGRSSGTSNVLLLGNGGAAPFVSSNVRATGQDRGVIARVGLNYKFNWF